MQTKLGMLPGMFAGLDPVVQGPFITINATNKASGKIVPFHIGTVIAYNIVNWFF